MKKRNPDPEPAFDAFATFDDIEEKAQTWAALVRGMHTTFTRALMDAGFEEEAADVLAFDQVRLCLANGQDTE